MDQVFYFYTDLYIDSFFSSFLWLISLRYNNAMKCINCQNEIPPQSRFCLNCGAAQPEKVVSSPASVDGGLAQPVEKDEEFSWVAREMQLDPNLDYESRQRYEGAMGQAVGCLAMVFFLLIGLVLLIPTVPLLAVFGLPLAVLLTILTYFNVARLQDRVRSIGILRKLPGFTSHNRGVLALCVGGYLSLASVVSILLMILNSARR